MNKKTLINLLKFRRGVHKSILTHATNNLNGAVFRSKFPKPIKKKIRSEAVIEELDKIIKEVENFKSR